MIGKEEAEETSDQVNDAMKAKFEMNEDWLTGVVDWPNGRLTVSE